MKKIINFLPLLVIFITLSCNNDGEVIVGDDEQLIYTKANIEMAPLEAQIDYAEKHLLNVGKEVFKLYKTNDFKSFFNDEIKKKDNRKPFYSFLVKNLVQQDISKKMNVINNQKLNTSLEAFYDLDGQDWHPEIIVYNFEENYTKSLSKGISNKQDRIYIVPVVYENNDPKKETEYKAYYEDENGNVVKADFTVTRSDANTKNIMYVKLAEGFCPIEQGTKSTGPIELIDDCDGGGGGGGGGGGYTPKYKLDWVTAKHFKEDVGRSEVSFKTQAYNVIDNGYFGVPSVTALNQTNRHVEYSFKRSWIRNDSRRYIDQVFIYADPVPTGPYVYFATAVAEWDSWPAPSITVEAKTTLPSGRVLKIPFNFHSWNTPYTPDGNIVKGIINHTYNSAGIEYYFRYK